jgi:hypothetical protein
VSNTSTHERQEGRTEKVDEYYPHVVVEEKTDNLEVEQEMEEEERGRNENLDEDEDDDRLGGGKEEMEMGKAEPEGGKDPTKMNAEGVGGER